MNVRFSIVWILLIIMSLNVAHGQRRADKKYELKAFNLAITDYKRYISQFPSSADAMAKLADCYRHINQLSEAAEWYERAFSASQTIDPIHYLYYGKVLMGLQRYDEASREFRRYSQVNADLGNHFYEKAINARRNAKRRSKYGILPMDGLNTAASDFCPTFFTNEQLIYSSARSDVGKSRDNLTGKSKNQLFVAKYKDVTGRVEADRLLVKNDAGSKQSTGPVSYSADGRIVVITKNNFIDGTRHLSSSGMKLDLYIAQAMPDGSWRNEEPFIWNSDSYSTGFGFLAEDGQALYYASNRPGGIGGFDIYVSYRTSSSWSNPKLLSPSVNTPGDEITPYFDGRTLYFASDWHNGYGGYDIFRSEKQNDQWSVSRNMGVGINSPRDDYGFIFDGVRNLGYFTSNRKDSKGSEDIYMVSRQTNEVEITVLNATDNSPIDKASVDFSDCNKGVFQTNVNGTFKFRANEDIDCKVIIRKEGYGSASVDLNALTVSRQKTYPVKLQKPNELYTGLLLDVDTRLPIANAKIQLRDQRTNRVAETETNANGEYTLAMLPNSGYTIRYSKAGYSDENRSLQVGNGSDRFLLGTMPLRRVGSTTPVVQPPQSPNVQQPPAVQTSMPDLGALPKLAYTVQIAAVQKADLTKYASLSNLGNVYYANVSGIQKIRVGVFLTEAEAKEALASIKKAGYASAFIVEEVTADVQDKLIIPQGFVASSGIQEETLKKGVAATINGYKIQIAASKNPNFKINTSKVSSLGIIERKPKNEWFVWLITGFSDLEDAKRAVKLVKQRGFKEAFVVYDENGVISRVKA